MAGTGGRLRAAALALALAALVPGGGPPVGDLAAAAPELRGGAEVVDGDTLEVGATRVRLFGVDAPEARQACDSGAKGVWRCGAAATARLGELIGGRQVACMPRERDRYGRIVATCRVGAVDLGGRLVAEGLARAYTRFGDDYAAAERRAKTERIGLWHGAAAAPWEFRAEARSGAAPAGPPSQACRIKGNVATSGARVYHRPGGRFYERTRVDPRRGESWFCDEAAALAAGFRPAHD